MKTSRPSPFATLVLAVPLLVGCGSSGNDADSGSGASTGGTIGTGGLGTGGSPATGGVSGTGGTIGTGGLAATGGTAGTGNGGRAASGGAGGGVAGAGGAGGRATGSGGAAGIGGAAGTNGAAGTRGAAGSGPGGSSGAAGGSVPTGYPMPTTTNRAACMSVPQTTSDSGVKICPGGGAGPVCVECLFGGSTYDSSTTPTAQCTSEAGNYAVTVTLGGSAAGQTEIDAETNRMLLAPTDTAAGQSVTTSFVVNVRAREGQPTESVAAGYPGLDLFFSGTTADPPQVSAVGYALVSAATKPIMVYVAGDSTVCDQTDWDYAGWGEMLPQFFAPPIGIANYADSGESSVSFLASGAEWGAIKSAMTTGDWVLIQFGHNDKTTTSATFQADITQMVKDAKAKGATPVLIAPPARATYSGGTLTDQSSLHTADMQTVATAQNVAFINLTSITTDWYNQLGSSGWQQYHALGTDATHTNRAGADKIAGFVVAAIKSQKIGLQAYLRN